MRPIAITLAELALHTHACVLSGVIAIEAGTSEERVCTTVLEVRSMMEILLLNKLPIHACLLFGVIATLKGWFPTATGDPVGVPVVMSMIEIDAMLLWHTNASGGGVQPLTMVPPEKMRQVL